MTSDTTYKRCDCPEQKQLKCKHPWYMKQFFYGLLPNGKPKPWEMQISRWAVVFLNGEIIESKTRAEQIVKIIRGRIVDGTYVDAKTAKRTAVPTALNAAAAKITLDELRISFDEKELTKKKKCSDESKRAQRHHMRQLCEYDDFGSRPADSFTPDDLIEFKDDELDGQGVSSWRKHFDIYQRMFNHGIRLGAMKTNPMHKATMTEEQWQDLERGSCKARDRRLKVGEREKLHTAALTVITTARLINGKTVDVAASAAILFAAQRNYDVIEFALKTAGRKGEIFAIQWQDVAHGDELTPSTHVTFAAREKGAAKTGIGKSRKVKMTADIRELLLTRRINKATGEPFALTDYVFGNELGERMQASTLNLAWKRIVCLMAGHAPTLDEKRRDLSVASKAVYKKQNLHFHDLRRECASTWYETGAFKTLMDISNLLGHKDEKTTRIYLNLRPAGIDEGMDRFEAIMAERERAQQAVGGTADKLQTNVRTSDPKPSRPRLIKGHNSGDRK